jgi:hypothetical protein
MTAVNVKLGDIGSQWTAACKQAVSDLNSLFMRKGIEIKLALNGAGPTITVKTDPGILGTAVHGQTAAETDGAGKLRRAEVGLPVKLTINTPKGIRDAGIGMAEVVAAHEFVHALGHVPHNSHLMAQTLQKVMGDRPRQAEGGRCHDASAGSFGRVGRDAQGNLELKRDRNGC